MLKKSLLSIALSAAVMGSVQAAAVSDEIIQESFYPYADGVPSFPGLEVGMTIDQSNVE